MELIFLVILVFVLIYCVKKKNFESFQSINKSKFVDNNLDIFYINLDISAQRKLKMENQLKVNNFNYNRFPAYNGKFITKDFRNSLTNFYKVMDVNGYIYNNKKGSLGNFVSQLTCWNNFCNKSNKKYLMVMEDDIVFNGLNKNIIYDVLKELRNEDWTMVKFFCFASNKKVGKSFSNNLVKTNINRGNPKNKFNTGMQCYILNKKNIPRLIKDMLPIKNETFDIMVKMMMNKHNIYITKKNYVLTPEHNKQSDRKKVDYS